MVMADTLPTFELYAIRYAMREARRGDHFIGGDPHDAPMAMDYFLWVARARSAAYVIDTGFTAEVARKRKRTLRDRSKRCGWSASTPIRSRT